MSIPNGAYVRIIAKNLYGVVIRVTLQYYAIRVDNTNDIEYCLEADLQMIYGTVS